MPLVIAHLLNNLDDGALGKLLKAPDHKLYFLVSRQHDRLNTFDFLVKKCGFSLSLKLFIGLTGSQTKGPVSHLSWQLVLYGPKQGRIKHKTNETAASGPDL